MREAQNKDFQDNEHEMSLTIDELSRALVAAKKDMSFVQVNAKMSDRKPNTQALISALSKLIEASSIGQIAFRLLWHEVIDKAIKYISMSFSYVFDNVHTSLGNII